MIGILRIVLTITLAVLALTFPACTGCTTEKPPAEPQVTTPAETETRIPRRKIEKLDSKTFIELSIDLMRESAKWNEEMLRLMQQKRTEYFASFGLPEKQFNEFNENNAAEWQRFLQENPRYNQEFMEAYTLYSRQHQ
ncbi:MAG: hypothetical protein LBC99_00420 [Spirochaetota bacterium]|jgi:hypothetical protein|nr:hypothetical protein [Spirochaetota bacterium]